MHTIPSNATRVQRFRQLKATLRTAHDRLLVGIDVAKAQHVAQVRLAHTRILEPKLTIPNTHAGFEAFWARLQARRREAGVSELVCAVEPTGTYHQALATFLERQGATVVFVSTHVAQLNRRTLDGTWGKSDPKDAHNLCDLLEQGKVLCSSLPDAPLAELRRLVRLLRRARAERTACRARFRITLVPQFGPAGEPLPAGVAAGLPPPLRALLPKGLAPRGTEGAPPRPPALAAECADLAAQLTGVEARILTLAGELVRVAAGLPAYALLRTIPGIGPTVAAILVAEIGDIAWDHALRSAPETRGAGHRVDPNGAMGRGRPDLQGGARAAALGAVSGGHRRDPESGVAGAAGGAAGQAGGGSLRLLQGEHRAGGEAPAPRVGRVAERAAV
jgi:transposase